MSSPHTEAGRNLLNRAKDSPRCDMVPVSKPGKVKGRDKYGAGLFLPSQRGEGRWKL